MRKLNRNIYFDHNATSYLLPQVKEAMVEMMSDPLNASSIHGFGRNARKVLDFAREEVRKSVGLNDDYNLIFTSSGTESNNIALCGLKDYQLITTPVEHQSVLSVVGQGIIPVDTEGVVVLEALEEVISKVRGKFLVSVQLANNETGVIQPIAKICEIVHRYGGLVHSDAVQAFGRIDCNVEKLGIDLITLSAHKIGGPLGVAALGFRKNIPLQPLMKGGGQEYRFRPGTQNTIAIKGFGIIAALAETLVSKFLEVEVLRNFLQHQLSIICSQSIIFGKNAQRLPNTLSISMPTVSSETQVIYFDINKIAVSAGSACSSGAVSIPYVQMAMGYSEEIARCALRISLGIDNTKEEVEQFIEYWKNLYHQTIQLQQAV